MRTLRPNDVVIWQDVPDAELVLLHPDTGVYYGLNASGGLLWRTLAARPSTADELVDTLVEAFEVDRARATDDVSRVIAALSAAGLVTGARNASPEPGPDGTR